MAEITPPKAISSERIVSKTSDAGPSVKMGGPLPVALFDSGVGGLSVLKEVIKQMPGEDVIYFADTARVPYGGRAPQELVKFNYEIINFLIKSGAKMIIMACGTSSAVAYPIVKEHYKIPIVPLIEPGSRAAVSATDNKKIGVIATQATIDSSAYQRAIKKINREIQVFSAACPLFVPLIEGGFLEAEETKRTAQQYLKPLLKAGIDTLILGCTHYPHLIKVLREVTGIKIKFIDPAQEAVSEARNILKDKGLSSMRSYSGLKVNYEYYVTGPVGAFTDLASRLLDRPVSNVKQVLLAKIGRKVG